MVDDFFTKNVDLKPGETVYYYPGGKKDKGLQPATILEKLNVSKYRSSGWLTYYLVEKRCSLDCYMDMLTNMQIRTKEQKDIEENRYNE